MGELFKTLPRTVLVVDDEQVVTTVLEQLLSKHDLPVRSAATARQALELLEREPFGCLIVDKNLPDQSGLEVLRAARSRQPHCACLLMTGFPNAESVIEAMRLGAVDYLGKPFSDLGLVAQRVLTTLEYARTAFEREELVIALEAMKQQLKRTEDKVQERQTALQVFRNVLAQEVDNATRGLTVKTWRLESLVQDAHAIALGLADRLSGPEQRTARDLAALLNPPGKQGGR